jgi:hypothetical protein
LIFTVRFLKVRNNVFVIFITETLQQPYRNLRESINRQHKIEITDMGVRPCNNVLQTVDGFKAARAGAFIKEVKDLKIFKVWGENLIPCYQITWNMKPGTLNFKSETLN